MFEVSIKLICAVLTAYVVVDLAGVVTDGETPAIVTAVMNVWPLNLKNLVVLAVAAAAAYYMHGIC